MRIYIVFDDENRNEEFTETTSSMDSLGSVREGLNLLSPKLSSLIQKELYFAEHEVNFFRSSHLKIELLSDPLALYIFDENTKQQEFGFNENDNCYNIATFDEMNKRLHKLNYKALSNSLFPRPFAKFLKDLKDDLYEKFISCGRRGNQQPPKFDSFSDCTLDQKEEHLPDIAFSIISQHTESLDNLLIPEKELRFFLESVQCLYLQNSYHNFYHAVDVLQCTSFIIRDGGLSKQLKSVDEFAILVASFCHDIGHLGVNNNFLREYNADLALLYNGLSPLENYHAFLTFFILEHIPECDVTKHWDITLKRKFKKLVVEAILATDMANHSRYMALFKSPELHKDKGILLSLVLKASDLSNVTRPLFQSQQWGISLRKEFYKQGEFEKFMGYTPKLTCMDNVRDEFEKGQVEFLERMARPLFDVLVENFPGLEYMRVNLLENIKEWTLKQKK